MEKLEKIMKDVDYLLTTHSGTIEELDNDIDNLLKTFHNTGRMFSPKFLGEYRLRILYLDSENNKEYSMNFIKTIS